MKNKNAEKIAAKLASEFVKIRKEKGLSHDKVAALSGLSRSAISMIESGQRIPTIVTCLKICDALEVSLSDLLKLLSKN